MTLDLKQLEPEVERMAAYLVGDDGLQIPLVSIRPSRWQPREPVFDEEALWELAKSIDENGLINAVVLFPVDSGYELVAGERRTRATAGLALAKALDNHTPKEYVFRLANVGLTGLGDEERRVLAESGATISARVESAVDLVRLHRMAVVENLERANLSPLEEARALAGLAEAYEWSQRDLARHLGKSQGWVAQRLALLDLPAAAHDALNTRVLNLTHARSLQGIPETVAPAVTQNVAKRVKRGATTREINQYTGKIKALLDLSRYEPDPDRIYEPKMRNRLALLRWLVETTDWQTHADHLLSIAKYGYLDDLDPPRAWHLNKVVDMLGYDDLDDVWFVFAVETGRLCETCRWNDWHWNGDEWDDVAFDPPCKRWHNADVDTCQHCIRMDDPEIVRVPYTIRVAFDDLQIPYEAIPEFNYVTSIARFVEDYARVQVYEAAKETEREEREATAHVRGIERYYEWQCGLPADALTHVRAHACDKCAYHILHPDVPCFFVQEPLCDRRGLVRAPEFGALVMQNGLMLPRCEMFTYMDRVSIKRVAGTRLVSAEQAMDWLIALAGSGANAYYKIWAILQWMDYGRLPGHSGRDQDLGMLKDHLLATWLLPQAHIEEEMPTLLDVVMSEAHPRVGRNGVIRLINPVTGKPEQFVPIDFEVAVGDDTWPHWKDYPDEWPRPWLDLQGNVDDGA